MLSKEKETLDALQIALSSRFQPSPSESQMAGVEEEDKEKQGDIENISFHESTWEQRYEKIWVEIEKKETKSQYRNVTAELKERFGEIEHKVEIETVQDKETKEEKEEANNDVKQDPDAPDGAAEEYSSEGEEELIVRPTTQARSVRLLPIPEQRESGQDESYSEEFPNNDFAKHKDIKQHSSESLNKTVQETKSSSHQMPGYDVDAFSNVNKKKENLRSTHWGDHQTPFAIDQEPLQEAEISPSHSFGDASLFPSMPDTVSSSSDELVEEDLQRSINEVGKWRRRKS